MSIYDVQGTIIMDNAFVTPQMFGAAGDGTTDDTAAIQAALDTGGRVVFPVGDYIVSSKLLMPSYSTIEGETCGYDAANKGVKIIASSGFTDDYVLEVIPYQYSGGTEVSRGINIENIVINCRGKAGGFRACAIYDSSAIRNFTILNVKADCIGFNSDYNGSLSQTVILENVFCYTNQTYTDTTIPMINIERWQECTLINVKAFIKNNVGFNFVGCRGLVSIMCAAVSLGIIAGSTALNVASYRTVYSDNLTFINFLNEGCENGVSAFGTKQSLTGTFNNVSQGAEITQGNTVGYVSSYSETVLNVVLEAGYFESGECSLGTISSVSTGYTNGLILENFSNKIGNTTTSPQISIEGFGNSSIHVASQIGGSPAVFNTAHNFFTSVIYAPDRTITVNDDGSTNYVPFAYEVKNRTTAGQMQPWATQVNGNKFTLTSNGTTDQITFVLTPNAYEGQRFQANFFHKATFERINGKWVLVEFVGDNVVNNTDSASRYIIAKNKEQPIQVLSGATTTIDRTKDNVHFTNLGITRNTDLAIVHVPKYWTCKVSCLAAHTITLRLYNGATWTDGTTDPVTLSQGDTKEILCYGNNVLGFV